MSDREFIKKFSQITITRICEIEGINKINLWNGKTTDDNYRKVRKRIESEIARLYSLPYPEPKKER